MAIYPGQAVKRPTINDVALRAEVSKGTVSKALRGGSGVSEETRNRVLATAHKLEYRRSTDHQRRGRIHIGQIGFLVIDPSEEVMSLFGGGRFQMYPFLMIEGCMGVATEHAESLSISYMIWDDLKSHKIPGALSRRHVDGLVVRGWLNDEIADWLGQLRIPIVLVDCNRHLPGYSHVRIEHLRSMDRLVEHLVEQGCRRFATITGDLNHSNGQERLAGLRVALKRRGLEISEDTIMVGRHHFSPPDGRDGVAEIMDAGKPFDVLVCQSDTIAAGALEELQRRGCRVPEDVRVVGFDDVDEARFYNPPLTTVRAPTYRIGQTATELLYEEMDLGRSKQQTIQIEGELVKRQSG